jgi:ubiquinone/menaquinone biosynthesis C-methylase UbiE
MKNLPPENQFTNLARNYSEHRPGYPPALIAHVIKTTQVDNQSLLIDIGSGTGISSRLFAALGLKVIGIEPDNNMRLEAQRATPPDLEKYLHFQAGRGEATGLSNASADLIICAQAFHWLDANLALKEFERILKPGGWYCLLGYEFDSTDPFSNKFAQLITSLPDAKTVEEPRINAGKNFLALGNFCQSQEKHFPSQQILPSTDALVGRALSISYSPRQESALSAYVEAVRNLAKGKPLTEEPATLKPAQAITLKYTASCYLGQKPF